MNIKVAKLIAMDAVYLISRLADALEDALAREADAAAMTDDEK